MVETGTANANDAALSALLGQALEAMSGGVGALIDRPVAMTASGRPFELDGGTGRKPWPTCVALTGQLEKASGGGAHLLLGLAEAVAMASYMMMVPDEAIRAARQAGTFSEDDRESLSEVGNVVFSAFDECLRAHADGRLEVRHREVTRADDTAALLGDGRFLVQPLSCAVGEFPAAEAWLVLPWEACEALCDGPLELGHAALPQPAPEPGAGARLDEDDDGDDRLEDIPEAELRGSLAAYARNPALLRKLKKSCRRLGLTLEKRHKGEVPNPSALRDHVVFLEIDRGEPRRFEWCRRLEAAGIQVLVLLLKPTRHQVALAFQAGANRICGWPLEERQLSERLRTMLDGEDDPLGEEPAAGLD
ncbi:MAG: hypothetical protein R3F30_08205 [Planctomycetota bacterium]